MHLWIEREPVLIFWMLREFCSECSEFWYSVKEYINLMFLYNTQLHND